MKIAGVILAGGQSKRMGSNKALLKLNGKTLLQHAKQTLSLTGINNIFISGKQGIKDQFINQGPVAGIFSCLEHLQEYDSILFTPIDMPLLNKFCLLKLISKKKLHTVYFKNHQLPILIQNNIINQRVIKQQLDNNNLSIRNMLEKLDAKQIESFFPENIFSNINTKEEWLKLQEGY